MHFRAQRKCSQDVSLSDFIETGSDGAELSLMEVLSSDDDLLESISTRESVERVRNAVKTCLTEQERKVITMRYGLGGMSPGRQREVAQATGISRSYVSHHAYCKRCPESRMVPRVVVLWVIVTAAIHHISSRFMQQILIHSFEKSAQ